MSLILNGTDGVQFNDSSLQGAAASPYVLKNRIINGDMRIDQRNAGASVTVNTGDASYACDRFQTSGTSSAGVYTAQQVSDAPTSFTNSLKITTTTASSSIGSTTDYLIGQKIEGFNFSDLQWGTANAKTITLSFWVKSSLTGAFAGVFANSAWNRSYVFTYTISAANTWEQKTITVAGDTTGTWIGSTNGTGLRLFFSLGSGSTFLTTANTWTTGLYESTSGAVNIISTLSATWQITGVQLEQNTVATPFERRLYNTELANCQRYYIKLNTYGVYLCIPSTSRNDRWSVVTLPVPMRASPTLTLTADASVAASTADNITITISVDAGNTTTAKSWTTLVSSAEL